MKEMSGSKLSRNLKSKVLFLGAWKSPEKRPPLPVKYLKEEKELKIFGFQITANYKETVKRNWEERIKKLRGVLCKWKDRDLPTLEQRVQVVNIYLASTLWYTAQVLPLPTKYRKQIDTELGRFIFHSRITMGRLKLEELCHPVRDGGMGLWDTARKAEALLTTQTLRMVERRGPGWKHLSYWLEATIGDKLNLSKDGPRSLEEPPELHRKIGEVMRRYWNEN